MADAGGDDAREWLSLEDPHEHRTWLFDVTFLLSHWACIFGRGCPGIDEHRAPELELGCCTHGAFLTGDDDLAHVRAMIAELEAECDLESEAGPEAGLDRGSGPVAEAGLDRGAELWQLRCDPQEALWQDEDGWWRTRVVDGACVFANRAGHPAGSGCAFHLLAQRLGRRPIDTKPEVCWQAPLRREDHQTVTGHVYSMVREWELRDWGGPDTDVWWWCTSQAEAHVGHRPVYQSLRDELVAICGPEIYEMLRVDLDRRADSAQLLAHPAVRRPTQ